MAKKFDRYKQVGRVVEKIAIKKKRPKFMATVDEDNCTGCQVCVPFCPTDCIRPVPAEKYGAPIPPVQIVYDHCVGCMACQKACADLTWDAIRKLPTKTFEARFGMVINDAPGASLEDSFRMQNDEEPDSAPG